MTFFAVVLNCEAAGGLYCFFLLWTVILFLLLSFLCAAVFSPARSRSAVVLFNTSSASHVKLFLFFTLCLRASPLCLWFVADLLCSPFDSEGGHKMKQESLLLSHGLYFQW